MITCYIYACYYVAAVERTESQVGDSWSLEHITHIPPTPTFVSAGLSLKPAHPPRTVLGERASGHHHPGSVFSQVHGRSQLLLGLPGPLIICPTLTTWLSLSALDNHLS